MEARESQRELMTMAACGTFPTTNSISEKSISVHTLGSTPAFVDLEYLRQKIGNTSTATSLESLASSMDLRDEFERLKQEKELIAAIGKESQLKEQVNIFKDSFPACSSKRPRNH